MQLVKAPDKKIWFWRGLLCILSILSFLSFLLTERTGAFFAGAVVVFYYLTSTLRAFIFNEEMSLGGFSLLPEEKTLRLFFLVFGGIMWIAYFFLGRNQIEWISQIFR